MEWMANYRTMERNGDYGWSTRAGWWKSTAFALAFVAANFVFMGATQGQAVGDYRSVGGNWGTLSSWQRLNALPSTWATPTVAQGYPGQNAVPGTVTILNGDAITLNVSPANNIGSLVIEGGGSDSDLIFSGTNSLTVSGAVTINAGTGTGGSDNDDKIIAVNAGTLVCGSITIANTPDTDNDSEVTISTGTVTVSGNITMNGSSSVNAIRFSNSGTLNVGGSISGGTIVASTGTVNYNGSSPQSVSNYSYHNLTLSGAGAKTLGDDQTITGNLLIESGATLTLGGNDLTISVNANRSATINGTLNINGNGRLQESSGGTKTLIIGSGGYLSITDNGGTGLPPLNDFSFDANSTVEFGSTDVQPVSRTPTYGNLVLSGSGNKTFASGGPTTIVGELAINGSAIALLANSTTSASNTLTFNGAPQASGSWGGTLSSATNKSGPRFGTTTTGILNVSTFLPITLLSFQGAPIDQTIALTWTTASELNNDYMAVERSPDGLAFDEIGRVAGRGTTYEPQSYRFVDQYPVPGVNYYRLRQVDFDGTTEYHPVISVVFEGREQAPLSMRVYPNPAREEVRVQWSGSPARSPQGGDGAAAAVLRVFDSNGRQLAQYALNGSGGVYNVPVQNLPAGVYVLQLVQGGQVKVERVVKE